eukprot:c9231_g1_i2.p1 GENE.c9231_g1_i2~~c9231_g1_i2.p1  ORF type:complete len:838 (-),score=267.74 c9231_g1_i2:44-2359(-)
MEDSKRSEKYIGKFQSDLRHGYGSLFCESGVEHFGDFEKDEIHGWGLRVFEDQSWLIGVWEHNELTGSTVPYPPPHGKSIAKPTPRPLPVKLVRDLPWNDGTYTGQVNAKEEPHGRGVWTTKPTVDTENIESSVMNPALLTYRGQFVNGKFSGHGVMESQAGTYDGDWSGNEKNGDGYEVDDEKNEYTGQFKNGQRHGKGVLKLNLGGGYEGQWKNGLQHGEGRKAYSNGDIYVGSFRESMRHGKGEWITATVKFDGEWKYDRYHGKGTKVEETGDVYVGQFRNGRRQGKGELKLKTGGTYTGEWKAGKAHGKGTLTDREGTTYTGQFQNGVRHGKGVLKLFSGDVYDGYFENGLMHGQGKYTWVNLIEYSGEFQQGRRHGKGTLTFSSVEKYVGEFKEGRRHGEAILSFARGGTHYGSFANDRIDGDGIRVLPDGSWYRGTWHEDVFDGDMQIQYCASPILDDANMKLQSQLAIKRAEAEAELRDRSRLWDISVPCASIRVVKGKEVTTYRVEMRSKVTDKMFAEEPRYSELLKLSTDLAAKFPEDMFGNHFPPKKFFGANDPTFVEQRRQEIEKYLKAAILHRKVVDSSLLRKALGVPENYESTEDYQQKLETVLEKIRVANTQASEQQQSDLKQSEAEKEANQREVEKEMQSEALERLERLKEEDQWVHTELERMKYNEWDEPQPPPVKGPQQPGQNRFWSENGENDENENEDEAPDAPEEIDAASPRDDGNGDSNGDGDVVTPPNNRSLHEDGVVEDEEADEDRQKR